MQISTVASSSDQKYILFLNCPLYFHTFSFILRTCDFYEIIFWKMIFKKISFRQGNCMISQVGVIRTIQKNNRLFSPPCIQHFIIRPFLYILKIIILQLLCHEPIHRLFHPVFPRFRHLVPCLQVACTLYFRHSPPCQKCMVIKAVFQPAILPHCHRRKNLHFLIKKIADYLPAIACLDISRHRIRRIAPGACIAVICSHIPPIPLTFQFKQYR